MAAAPEPSADPVRQAASLIDQERDREAFELLEPLAQDGDVRAQALLGWMREVGRGCERDPVLAESLYRASADQGYASAQLYLGGLYHRRGDRELARSEYERAAQQEFLPAYYRLAMMRLLSDATPEAGIALLREGKRKGHLPCALRLIGFAVRGRYGCGGWLPRLRAIIEAPLAMARFARIYVRTSNDERVLF
jgi:TPR repeat protein